MPEAAAALGARFAVVAERGTAGPPAPVAVADAARAAAPGRG